MPAALRPRVPGWRCSLDGYVPWIARIGLDLPVDARIGQPYSSVTHHLKVRRSDPPWLQRGWAALWRSAVPDE